MIKHLRRWNIWRKRSLNSKFYKLLVLLGFMKSPTMMFTFLPEELACPGYLDGIEPNNQHFNLEEHDKQIRAEAIDEFANSVLEELKQIAEDWKYYFDKDNLSLVGTPSSYNQTRNVMLNYEVLANMYHSRKTHKLDEWVEFCKWIEGLPYAEIITGGVKNGL